MSTNGPRHSRPLLRALPQRSWPLDAPTPPTGTPTPAPDLVKLMNPRRPTALLLAASGLALTLGLIAVGSLASPTAPPQVSAPALAPVTRAAAGEFGDGTHRVGSGVDDVAPGLYLSEGGRLCNWSVISAGGSHSGQGKGAGRHEVTLRSAQKITSGGCGQWTRQG